MPRANILMVDDKPARSAWPSSAILDDLDQNLVEAHSGRTSSFASCKGDEFAVVLLDIFLPGLDGFATAKLIREQESRHTPITFF